MAFAEIFHWIAFGVLAAFGVIGICGNACGPICAVITKKNFSMVPLIGGVSGAVACAIAPWPWLRPWWWLPLVADLGTLLFIPGVAYAVVLNARDRRSDAGNEKP